ncbi:MAG: trypsin-like peptidase domain-containing protein [Acidobacteria bacterium]|nr:trypsin-like peptidase domain-containing protein [Acidobacteriota bacterium]
MTDIDAPAAGGTPDSIPTNPGQSPLTAIALGVAVLALAVAGAGMWIAVVRDGDGTDTTAAPGTATAGVSSRNELFDGPADLPAVIDEVRASVVAIECGDGGGTGFAMNITLRDPSGPFKTVIVTNHHVIDECIDGAQPLSVFGGPEFEEAGLVEIAGSDETNDLALIEVDLEIPSIKEAETFAVRGWWTMTIGHPYDDLYEEVLYDYVTIGHIGYVLDESVNYTSAIINPGNSGGPLVNARGELIGITSMSQASTEAGVWNYAIDSDVLCESLLDC